jgi:hypothetical protein
LNLIERSWKPTHRLCLHHRHFPDPADVMAAVEGQFECWTRPNKPLKKLCGIA